MEASCQGRGSRGPPALCDVLRLFLGKVHLQSPSQPAAECLGSQLRSPVSMLTPNCSLAAQTRLALQGPRAFKVRPVWGRRLSQAATPAGKPDGGGVGAPAPGASNPRCRLQSQDGLGARLEPLLALTPLTLSAVLATRKETQFLAGSAAFLPP